jgi:aerobic-type carbon monoxide dehydrogenase small subunit (CoxS/CutS family)
MRPDLNLSINGMAATAVCGHRLAATLINVGVERFRVASDGSPRSAFCGMGICMECRVRVNGNVVLACLVEVAEGMQVSTDA